jgi:hypothetical protein
MLLECHESLMHEFPELAELLGLLAPEDIEELLSQLERRVFKSQAFARGVRQQETKVDVYDMTFLID